MYTNNEINNDLPLVSVCMPIYNPDHYFIEAIECALNQTYPNIEILIVDDCSSKIDERIRATYFLNHPKIRYVKNEVNLGLVGNWSKSIELAKGDWIKFHFQDDLMESNCVSEMMAGIIKNNTQAALCSRSFVFEDNADKDFVEIFSKQLVKPEMLFKADELITPEKAAQQLSKFLFTNVVGEPICLLFSKQIYHKVGGFNINMRQVVDYEFSQKIMLASSIYFTDKKLVSFRVHKDSTSSKNVLGNSKENTFKKLASVEGDYLILLYNYLYIPLFVLIKQQLGEKVLQLVFNRIYWRACGKNGTRTVNAALEKQLAYFPEKVETYNYLKYKLLKYKFKKEVLPFVFDFEKDAIKKIERI